MGKPRILVITSCTGEKSKDTPDRLTLDDFRDHERLLRRQRELVSLSCKATDLYTGDQHIFLKRGINIIRGKYGREVLSLNIVSAGYGLLSEHDEVVPYEATFNKMPTREIDAWSSHLGLGRKVRSSVMDYSLAMFLLGERYLRAIEIPLRPEPHQRFIFLAGASNDKVLKRSGAVVVRTGVQETRLYGSGLVALKGKMFELLCKGLVAEGPHAFRLLERDASPKAFLGLVRSGQKVP